MELFGIGYYYPSAFPNFDVTVWSDQKNSSSTDNTLLDNQINKFSNNQTVRMKLDEKTIREMETDLCKPCKHFQEKVRNSFVLILRLKRDILLIVFLFSFSGWMVKSAEFLELILGIRINFLSNSTIAISTSGWIKTAPYRPNGWSRFTWTNPLLLLSWLKWISN